MSKSFLVRIVRTAMSFTMTFTAESFYVFYSILIENYILFLIQIYDGRTDMNEAIVQYFTESFTPVNDRFHISRHEVEHDSLGVWVVSSSVIKLIEDLSLMAVRRSIFSNHNLLISSARILNVVRTLNSMIKASLRVQIRCSLRFIVVSK